MAKGITKSVSRAANVKIMVTLLMLGALFGACNRQNDSSFHLASTSDPNAPGGANTNSTTGNPAVIPVASYADVVSKVAPAVITVHSQMRVRQSQQYPFQNDPFFREFFGDRGPQQPPVERQSYS